MLFIGDLHCTSKIIDRLLEQTRQFIAIHEQEQTVIFLGDFVYHFSYDRRALAKCFELFVELWQSGKDVIVLAGNHDWISGQFVFHEGKAVMENVQQTGGSLEFVTTPTWKTIQQQDILLLPFHIPQDVDDISGQFSTLLKSGAVQEQRSGRVNERLYQAVAERKKRPVRSEKLLLCHHRYINNTIFPGQNARFSFKSPALSEHLLDDDELLLVSGHLHKPFVFKNYCCCGSVWSTSPLEVNQTKYLRKRDPVGGEMAGTPVWVNPYIQVPYSGSAMSEQDVTDQCIAITEAADSELQQGNWNVVRTPHSDFTQDHARTTLIITHDDQLSDSLEEYVDDTLRVSLRDVSVKQKQRLMHELLSNLTDASMDLDESIADRQTLLEVYLKKKYGDDYEGYKSLLQSLEILA